MSTAFAPGSQALQPSKPRHSENGGITETIESILIAFILAFIFRAFVVEAFVIPTGSMAPTLLGAHISFTCTDCGYAFDINYPTRGGGDDEVNIPSVAVDGATGRSMVFSAFCPNCGLKVPRHLKPDAAPTDEAQPGDPDNDATAPPVHYGDRILVLKYIYELFEPRRWDVVVFKTPDKTNDAPLYSINYIKRLIAKPNESVMILDGDIYISPKGAHNYVVQTKPRVAQEALWRVVYDNDYLPHRPSWIQPWQSDSSNGWNTGEPGKPARTFSFDKAAGDGWIAFKPDESPTANEPLTDWLAYAVSARQAPNLSDPHRVDFFDYRGERSQNNVSDLKLSLVYERLSGDGPLRLELTKLNDIFTAEISRDRVRLLHRQPGGSDAEVFASKTLSSHSGPVPVELTNVDYQVTLRIGGKVYFQTTPAEYHPDFDALMQAYKEIRNQPRGRARIGAESQSCRVSHVGIWRDVYYLNRGEYLYFGTPDNPVELGDDEYFVLGDNTAMSRDARYWTEKVSLPSENLFAGAARVPKRFMLGKAFFVYWPAGYRPFSLPYGIVPDFGSMRFIH